MDFTFEINLAEITLVLKNDLTLDKLEQQIFGLYMSRAKVIAGQNESEYPLCQVKIEYSSSHFNRTKLRGNT